MYFSRIRLQPLVDINRFAQQWCQDSYREHQVLWKLFDTDANARRDFIYRYELTNSRPGYYMVSQRIPEDQNDIWTIESKEYQPKLVKGQVLGFMLRANPVTTLDGKRHDVVMLEKHRINYKNMPVSKRPALQAMVQTAGYEWLAKRADNHGFQIEDEAVRIDGYQLHEARKSSARQVIRYSTIDYQGVLSVTDPEKFSQLLLFGLGKSKAFGCGLLLIRRL